MKSSLLFNFTVHKENKSIRIQRMFDAELALVWRAWTSSELLDQWWAPKPWKAETKSMVFKEGGHWHYAMVSPAGEKHWAKVLYLTIKEKESFKAKDGFCDENGTMSQELPQNYWDNQFISKENQTLVDVTLTFDSLGDLEKIIEMGFKEGFTAGLTQLDHLLETLKSKENEK
ncbi:SRPBCC domain-containing protein [Mesonia sp. K7]|uniref:SRPBCC family protein n=1 Tax=Mesonia sp. K7 TaxID=2218606 RepID=UPI000DAA3709|nr:SRPBCC domain-containing protein [Mesonia sp. K7]PZD76539.1 SRPBCC domain-containing protein [Mesonia sp. K7]